jgi:hypothetical protein
MIQVKKITQGETTDEMSMLSETPTGMINSYMRITYLPAGRHVFPLILPNELDNFKHMKKENRSFVNKWCRACNQTSAHT